MIRRLSMLVLMGCVRGGGAEDSAFDVDLSPPTITDVSVVCQPEAERWRLEVVTDAWSGGGGLLWTQDLLYLERHNGLRSIRAAANGERDLLRLDLTILADFRGAEGGRTAFTCSQSPSGIVWVVDLDDAVSSCVAIGPARDRLAELIDVPFCELQAAPDEPTPEDSGAEG